MSNNEKITPPPELVKQWLSDYYGAPTKPVELIVQIATQATRWGYEQRGAVNEAELQQAKDEELEACIKWLRDNNWKSVCEHLRAARRPKAVSLKEQLAAAIRDGDERTALTLLDEALPE